MKKIIGAQYYTIRDYCQTLEDFDASCKKIHEMGYTKVQLSGIGNFKGEEIKPILDKYGLTVSCTHRSPQNYLDDLEGEIRFHKAIGCKVCGIGAMPGFNSELATIEEFGKNFTQVCEKLKEHDLVFAYHNHAFEFMKIDGRHAYDIICENLKSDNFKLILDVYWLAFAGVNPAKFIREHKDEIACIHFKDLKVLSNSQVTFTEVGQGNLDWDDIIAACEEAEVSEFLVEQDSNWTNDDPFLSLKMSYDFLTTKGFI